MHVASSFDKQNVCIGVEFSDEYMYTRNNLKNHLEILSTRGWQTMTREPNPVTAICLSIVYGGFNAIMAELSNSNKDDMVPIAKNILDSPLQKKVC